MPPSPTRPGAWDEPRIKTRLFLILCLLAGVVFYPVLGGELLHWDDGYNISDNPHLTGLGPAQLKAIFTDTTYLRRYEPLCQVVWAAIRQCFGVQPAWFHLVLLLLHAVNAGLVFLLIRRLLLLSAGVTGKAPPRSFSIAAALATAIWAVHPMRVETTAWAVNLVWVLPLFFLLLSLLCYLRVPEGRRFYLASLGLFVLSLAAYPLALGMAVLCLALDFFPLRRLSLDPGQWGSPAARKIWLEKIPFVAAALFFGWLNLRMRGHESAAWNPPPTLAEFGVTARVMQAFYIWAHYLWKPWLPLHLTPVPTALIEFRPFAVPFVASALVVAGLTVVLAVRRRSWPGLFALWLCYLALLVPMLGLTEHPHYAADRYSLTVGIGWSIVLAAVFVKLWPRPGARRILIIGLAVLVPVLGVMSWRQTFKWRTNVVFFRGILEQLPDEPRFAARRLDVFMRLAAAHQERGEFAQGTAVLRDVVHVWPQVGEAHEKLGDMLLAGGDLDAASASYAEAVRIKPDLSPDWNTLGVAYAEKDRLDEAVARFGEALRREPTSQTALQNLVRALRLQGRTNEAEAYSKQLQTK